MTLDEWLRQRDPEPPAVLAEMLRAALGAGLDSDAREGGAICLAAAERELGRYLPSCAAGVDRALDLLTIDALATYAFELQATEASALADAARGAMRRLALLAEAWRV